MRIALLLVPMVAGCTHVQLNANTAPSNSAATVQVDAGRGLAAAVVAGAVVAAAVHDSSEPQSARTFSISEWWWPARAPTLSADRPVNEQDCTMPIEFSGNLKCR
jgi:hypothetical protein